MKPLLVALSITLATCLAFAPSVALGAERSNGPASQADAPGARAGIAKVRGGAFHYATRGDLDSGKTPVLVLHGAYMSSDGMAPFVERFARTRPVIVFDQRGHARTGDLPGPITYEAMADDAAALLDALGVAKADVVGYSMGGTTAIQLAIRHPEKVGRLVTVSAGMSLDAAYPEVLQGIAHITPAVFDNTAIRRDYDRLAPKPQDFPTLVDKLKTLDATPFDYAGAFGSIDHRTMIVAGDYDVVATEHAVAMFRARKGGAAAVAAQGFLKESPPARLLVLPSMSHLGVFDAADLIASQVEPFLEDAPPPMPKGFF